MPKMQGLYIHIPFCKSRCIYCGFFSTTMLDLRQQYVDALCQEMKMRCQGAENISTIYLGGGTPSQLTTDQLRQILLRAYIYNKVEKDAEVTIEVNPDDVTERFANDLTPLPVNRISMGVQTFDDKRLRFLHRRHTAEQVTTAVDRLRAAGIKNISIDLMYGFPGETIADCEADIAKALSLQVEHISTYCLMIEEDTQLQQMLQQGNITETEEELERQMYETIINRLEDGGYEQYELSNFARPGFHSRHNSSYWDGTPYIGIGAAAHSYDIESRSWNIADTYKAWPTASVSMKRNASTATRATMTPLPWHSVQAEVWICRLCPPNIAPTVWRMHNAILTTVCWNAPRTIA